MKNILVENFIKDREEEKQKIRKKRIKIFASCFAVLLVIITAYLFITNAFAENAADLLRDRENNQYLYFEIDHNIVVGAPYKYYGYGYTIALEDTDTGEFLDLTLENGNTVKQVFLPNSSTLFESKMVDSQEQVKMYIYKFFDYYKVNEEYYYSDKIRIHINGRLGLRKLIENDNYQLVHLYDSLEGTIVKGMPEGHKTGNFTTEHGTVPLNGDGCGIRNSIEVYFNTPWSYITYNVNLPLNFDIQYLLDTVARRDILYVEYKCEDEVLYSWDKIMKFTSNKTMR